MLTYHRWGLLAFISGHYPQTMWRYQSIKQDWNCSFKMASRSPRGQWVNLLWLATHRWSLCAQTAVYLTTSVSATNYWSRSRRASASTSRPRGTPSPDSTSCPTTSCWRSSHRRRTQRLCSHIWRSALKTLLRYRVDTCGAEFISGIMKIYLHRKTK